MNWRFEIVSLEFRLLAGGSPGEINWIGFGTNIHQVAPWHDAIDSCRWHDAMVGWILGVMNVYWVAFYCCSARLIHLSNVDYGDYQIDCCRNHVLNHYCPIKEIIVLIVWFALGLLWLFYRISFLCLDSFTHWLVAECSQIEIVCS